MMDTKMMLEAKKYLEQLQRVSSIEEGLASSQDVLYLSRHVKLILNEDFNVRTDGLDENNDKKVRDLLRIIKVKDPLNMQYEETNILSPSVYVHSLEVKPWHITTQGFLITHIHEYTKAFIREEKNKMSTYYGRHELDQFWLPCSKPLEETTPDDLVCIFNRRVSGWDGSYDRPVIELLGAGGHLQAVWDHKKKSFVSRSFADNLKKEFDEEIGLSIRDDNITFIGGFTNDKTQELVIFACIYIEEEQIPKIQQFALHNLEEDTDGIYLGTFTETMDYYKKTPAYFAGGVDAAMTNFPNNAAIMRRIFDRF